MKAVLIHPLLALLLTESWSAVSGIRGRTEKRLRKRLLPNNIDSIIRTESEPPIQCMIVYFDTWLWNDDETIDMSEETACIPVLNFVETEEKYTLELPDDIVKKYRNELEAGKLFLSIRNAIVVDDTSLILANDTKIEVIRDPRITKRVDESPTIGTKTIAVVRISVIDSEPSISATAIKRKIFSPNKINLKTQYEACSFGKLRWKLASAGVVEVFVNQTISNFTTASALVSAAQVAILEQTGYNAPDLADKVLMVVPPGTGQWLASSGINHWRAQFNDDWILSLSATAHELGHTLGLLHSNEDGPYGDTTGYMSYGHRSAEYPRKCFNGAKNWQLGWFRDRQLHIQSISDNVSYGLIKLATFVDYNLTLSDEPVLVNVLDEFILQYNVAKGMNVDTGEKKDQVTLTTFSSGSSESLAGLSAGDSYSVPNYRGTSRTLFVDACVNQTSEAGADIMHISVALDGQPRCFERWVSAFTTEHNRIENVTVSVDEAVTSLQNTTEDGDHVNSVSIFENRHRESPANVDALSKGNETSGSTNNTEWTSQADTDSQNMLDTSENSTISSTIADSVVESIESSDVEAQRSDDTQAPVRIYDPSAWQAKSVFDQLFNSSKP